MRTNPYILAFDHSRLPISYPPLSVRQRETRVLAHGAGVKEDGSMIDTKTLARSFANRPCLDGF